MIARAGIGLRAPHIGALLSARPAVGWLEVHPENVMADEPAAAAVERLRADYPVSLHGVGLSLAGPDPIDRGHLARLRAAIGRLGPALVSEHLAWSTCRGAYLSDLLPIPYTAEALAWVAARVDLVQSVLGMPILIENPSRYVDFVDSAMSEPEFLAALAARTGCGLLLDVNNVYVSAHNLALDAASYLAAIPRSAVREIHLAGHTAEEVGGVTLLIDTHAAPVDAAVWALYRRAVARFGPVPTLIEWDRDLPALEVLVEQAHEADRAAHAALLAVGHERAA